MVNKKTKASHTKDSHEKACMVEDVLYKEAAKDLYGGGCPLQGGSKRHGGGCPLQGGNKRSLHCLLHLQLF